MRSISKQQILNAVEQFCFEGIYQSHETFGNGHINDTFRLVFQTEKQETKRYILQRMNKDIFTKP